MLFFFVRHVETWSGMICETKVGQDMLCLYKLLTHRVAVELLFYGALHIWPAFIAGACALLSEHLPGCKVSRKAVKQHKWARAATGRAVGKVAPHGHEEAQHKY